MFHLSREQKIVAFIVILLLAILWLVITYFGVTGAVLYCLIFSFIATSFARYLFMWGGRTLSFAQNWLPPVLSLAATSFISLGMYHLVQFYQTGTLNTTVFFPWLAILLGAPTAYYGPPRMKHYLKLRHQARNCIEAGVTIKHEIDLPIYIKELRFVNSSSGRELSIPVSTCMDKSDRDDDGRGTSLAQKIEHAMRGMYFPGMFLPAGADKFYMSWYSLMEEKYYEDEFAFSFDGYSLRTMKYDPTGNQLLWKHLQRQNAGGISIRIHYGGNVRLYRYSDMLLCYVGAKSRIIGDEERESYLQRFSPYDTYTPAMVREMTAQERGAAVSRLRQRWEIQKRILQWSMRIEGLDAKNIFDIDDASGFTFRATREELSLPEKRALPEKIEVCYRSHDGLLPWLYIYLDVENLHSSLEQLTRGDHNMAVEFVVTVEENQQNSIQFLINTSGQSAHFNAWETVIKEEYKRTSKNLARMEQQRRLLHQMLNSAWDDVKEKKYQAAEEKCNELLSRSPEFHQVYFLQARLIFYKGGTAEYFARIEELYKKAEDDRWTLSRLYNSTGCILDEEQRHADALPYFIKASQLEPDEGMYLANIAELYYKLGQAKEAINYAHQAQAKNYNSEILNDILISNGTMK